MINNLVVISDIHAGCGLALCPLTGARLDDGGQYMPSPLQVKLWGMWREFWDVFVPDATRGEPFGVVVNGDSIDGVHHNSVTQISHNLEIQSRIAHELLTPIVAACEGRFWMVRGTEAHVGKSGQEEERLARSLNAMPNADGQYARHELWKWIGDRDRLVHLQHHVGTTGTMAYETTAVHKELTESFVEAARWNQQPPDAIVRSHRHRYIETTMATGTVQGEVGRAISVVTPGWQGKTPFAYKIAGARQSLPQFGGILIRLAHGRLFVDSYVRTIERSAAE